MITLVFPPQWHPGQPHLAMARLLGFLKNRNEDATVLDAGIYCYRKLLNPEYIKKCGKMIVNRIDFLEEKSLLSDNEQNELKHLLKWFPFILPVCDTVSEAVSVLCSKNGYSDVNQYIWAETVIQNALRIVSLPFYPECLALDYYRCGTVHENTDSLVDYTENRTGIFSEVLSMWYSEFKNQLISSSVVGINITDYGQMIPAFSILKMLKDDGFAGITVSGGSYVTKFAQIISRDSALFNYCDFLVIKSGEPALEDLIRYSKNEISAEQVRNSVSKYGIGLQMSAEEYYYDFTCEGSYISSDFVVPINFGSGCSYGKCAFCEHSYLSDNDFKTRNYDEFAGLVVNLSDTYKTPYFYFIDDMISAADIEGIGDALKKRDAQIYWMCYAMLQPQFENEHFLKKLYSAGLRKLWFGLESENQRVLRKMNKHRPEGRALNVAESCRKAGISIHFFCITGFPGETREEACETFHFFLNNQKIIDGPFFSADFFQYSCMRNSEVFINPEKYGIIPGKTGDIAISSDYCMVEGIDAITAAELIQINRMKIRKRYKKSVFPDFRESQDSTHLLLICKTQTDERVCGNKNKENQTELQEGI